MSSLSDEVPIPPKGLMNPNLSSASEKTMLKKFGVPGPLTADCGTPNQQFAKLLVFNENVGPFKVNGLRAAVESLKQVFAEVKNKAPDVYAAVRTDGLGMLCVRHKRKNNNSYSNHSWGTAIDLKFGPHEIDQGTHKTQRGFLSLYPIFNQFGWYWGAEFSGDYVDSMHFEWSEESILKLALPAPAPLAAHLSGIIEKAMAGHPDLPTAQKLVEALATSSTPPAVPGATPAAIDKAAGFKIIEDIAANSAIAKYKWDDRGKAPIGYTKVMALLFARAYCRLRQGDRFATEMAKADTNDDAHDALTHYRAQFKAAKMDNSVSGPDTLRHVFVLLTGLGMRESGGKHCDGRDTEYDKKNLPKNNKNAEEAEAGLFQLSYNSRTKSPLLPEIFQQYVSNPTSQFLTVFDEGGVRCTKGDAINWGEGPGVDFQKYSKEIPEFSVDYAAVALRVVRHQWGPINRHEAEVKPDCDAMFKQVQDAVDASQLCSIFFLTVRHTVLSP